MLKALDEPAAYSLDEKHKKEVLDELAPSGTSSASRSSSPSGSERRRRRSRRPTGWLPIATAQLRARPDRRRHGQAAAGPGRLQVCFDAGGWAPGRGGVPRGDRGMAFGGLADAPATAMAACSAKSAESPVLGDPVLAALGLAEPREAAEPYLLLAEVLTALRREGDLVPRLEALRADDPVSPFLAITLAEEYVKAKRLDRAEAIIACWRSARLRSPRIAVWRKSMRRTNATTSCSACWARRSPTWAVSQRWPKPTAAGWRQGVGRRVPQAANIRQKARPEGVAFPALVAAAGHGPGRQSLRRRGRVLQRRHRGQARGGCPSVPVWGLDLSFKEQYARAIDVFRRAADQQTEPGGDPRFSSYLADVLVKAGRTDEALAAAQKAVQIALARKPAQQARRSGLAAAGDAHLPTPSGRGPLSTPNATATPPRSTAR